MRWTKTWWKLGTHPNMERVSLLWRGLFVMYTSLTLLLIPKQCIADEPGFDYTYVEYRYGCGVRLWDYPPGGDSVSGARVIGCRNCSWLEVPRNVTAYSYISEGSIIFGNTRFGSIKQIGILSAGGNPMWMDAEGRFIGGGMGRATSRLDEANVYLTAGSNNSVSIHFRVLKPTLVTIVGCVAYAMLFGGGARPEGSVTGGGQLIGSFRLIPVYYRNISIPNPGALDIFEQTLILQPGDYIAEFSTTTHQWTAAVASRSDLYEINEAMCVMPFTNSVRLWVIRHPFRIPPGYRAYEVLSADINENGCIEDADLLYILSYFGKRFVHIHTDDIVVDPEGISADVNYDGVVDDGDLLQVFGLFGHCYTE